MQARQGRTTIIIAHRLSTVKTADLIMSLHEGKIAECGSHEELMKDPSSIYNQLVTSQVDCIELCVIRGYFNVNSTMQWWDSLHQSMLKCNNPYIVIALLNYLFSSSVMMTMMTMMVMMMMVMMMDII